MPMIQRKFYLPEELYERLQLQARIERKRITDVLREALSESLRKKERKYTKKNKQKHPLEGLLELAKRAEKEGWGKESGITDLAENHDKYLAEILEEDMKRIYEDNR